MAEEQYQINVEDYTNYHRNGYLLARDLVTIMR